MTPRWVLPFPLGMTEHNAVLGMTEHNTRCAPSYPHCDPPFWMTRMRGQVWGRGVDTRGNERGVGWQGVLCAVRC